MTSVTPFYKCPLRQLSALLFEEKQARHPTIPVEFLPTVRSSDRTKQGLINCTYHKLRLAGHLVKLNPRRKRGTHYDIETVLNGRTFYILCVPGALVQGTAQFHFQRRAEGCGAGYICVKTYSDFMMVYECIMEAETAQTIPA